MNLFAGFTCGTFIAWILLLVVIFYAIVIVQIGRDGQNPLEPPTKRVLLSLVRTCRRLLFDPLYTTKDMHAIILTCLDDIAVCIHGRHPTQTSPGETCSFDEVIKVCKVFPYIWGWKTSSVLVPSRKASSVSLLLVAMPFVTSSVLVPSKGL